MGILVLNNYGQHFPRRRLIEGGLVTLGLLLAMLAAAGPISRFLQTAETATGLPSLGALTSLLAVVVTVALLAGIAYAFVAIPSQTQLQEDIPEDVRGRVFGVLNMLVSVASFAPIIIVGPVADLVGNTVVLYMVAAAVFFSGIVSIIRRGKLKPQEAREKAKGPSRPAGLDPVAVSAANEIESGSSRRHRTAPGPAEAPPETPGPANETPGPASDTPGPASATPDEIADTSTDVS
jgi:MFS family permease